MRLRILRADGRTMIACFFFFIFGKLGRVDDRLGDCLIADLISLFSADGHNQLKDTKFTKPLTEMSRPDLRPNPFSVFLLPPRRSMPSHRTACVRRHRTHLSGSSRKPPTTATMSTTTLKQVTGVKCQLGTLSFIQ